MQLRKANERGYADTAYADRLSNALSNRFFLSESAQTAQLNSTHRIKAVP